MRSHGDAEASEYEEGGEEQARHEPEGEGEQAKGLAGGADVVGDGKHEARANHCQHR